MANLSYGVFRIEQWTHRRRPDSRPSSVGHLRGQGGSVIEVVASDQGSCCGLADCGFSFSVLGRWLAVQARRGRLNDGNVQGRRMLRTQTGTW